MPDNREWLLKEALTGTTTKSTGHVTARHHIHSWLQQIKNLTETEPVVFENFDIGRNVESVFFSIWFDVLFIFYYIVT